MRVRGYFPVAPIHPSNFLSILPDNPVLTRGCLPTDPRTLVATVVLTPPALRYSESLNLFPLCPQFPTARLPPNVRKAPKMPSTLQLKLIIALA